MSVDLTPGKPTCVVRQSFSDNRRSRTAPTLTDKKVLIYKHRLAGSSSPFLPVYFNTAMVYVTNGDCDRSYELLRASVHTQPEYHDGYQQLGVLLSSSATSMRRSGF